MPEQTEPAYYGVRGLARLCGLSESGMSRYALPPADVVDPISGRRGWSKATILTWDKARRKHPESARTRKRQQPTTEDQ